MNFIRKIYLLLDKKQKRKLFLIQLLVISTAVFESISVIAIAPLMIAITTPDNLITNKIYISINQYIYFGGTSNFIFYYSLFFLLLSFISNMLSIITIWVLSIFAADTGGEISNKLYKLYLSMNYSQFLKQGSSHMTKQIATEVSRVTDNLLQPIVQINARVFSGILICLLLFFYNSFAAILSVTVFSFAYLIIYLFVKKKLKVNGRALSEVNQFRFRYISEGFGAFREIKSFGVFSMFYNRFKKSSLDFSKAYSTLNTIYNIPKYIIEFFVFLTFVFLILKHNNSGNNVEILTIISVFGIAALKLLPIFQQIYSCFAQIRGHINALNNIYEDLSNNKYLSDVDETDLSIKNNFSQSYFVLQNICFTYNNDNYILKSINIEFNKNELNAIVGKSGAGKSTLADIITGLLFPTSGVISYYGEIIDENNLSLLRNSISIVPQFPYIFQGSIAQNIAFTFDNKYNLNTISNVIKLVGLEDMISSIDKGINTIIGDGNIQLSGGQKQRLAIARALYKDSPILFFDEPTSSLDPESEKGIINLIKSLTPNKTIIMISHKIEVIQDYNNIIVIDNGEVVSNGDYNDLLLNSKVFNRIMNSEK